VMASAEGQAPVAAAAEGAGAAHPAPVPESDENPSKRPRLESEPAAAAPIKAEGEGLSWNEARSVYRTQPAAGEAAASALTASKTENPAAAENATAAEAAEPFVKAEVKPEGATEVNHPPGATGEAAPGEALPAATSEEKHAAQAADPGLVTQAYLSRDETAKREEATGIIKFIAVSNDGKPEHMIWLITLKNIFSQQLPNMPREYIARLVLDRNHKSLMVVKNGSCVGGITFRSFHFREQKGFAEIAFCAIKAEQQVKGYGTRLMNHLKEWVKTRQIDLFVTYADNYAIGYFKKQGFIKSPPNNTDARYAGYIKDYDGGTLMECHINDTVPYLAINKMIENQQKMVQNKIASLTKSHVEHDGIHHSLDESNEKIPVSPEQIPGIADAGWKPNQKPILRGQVNDPKHMSIQEKLAQMIVQLKRESSSWPFHENVDGDVVRDYYKIILKPMSLATMEKKVEDDKYDNMDQVQADLVLICDNCRSYNAPHTQYYKAADIFEAAWRLKYFTPGK